MSKWRVGYDVGEWFVSEIGDQWGGFDSFDTEVEAIEELRRIQLRGVLAAEEALRMANNKLVEKQRALESSPVVRRMNKRAPEPSSTAGEGQGPK